MRIILQESGVEYPAENAPTIQTPEQAAAEALRLTDKKFQLGYGVEGFAEDEENGTPALSYINAGDTYTTTIVFYNLRFFVACWGDFIK